MVPFFYQHNFSVQFSGLGNLALVCKLPPSVAKAAQPMVLWDAGTADALFRIHVFRQNLICFSFVFLSV